jgi:hypothetical protein
MYARKQPLLLCVLCVCDLDLEIVAGTAKAPSPTPTTAIYLISAAAAATPAVAVAGPGGRRLPLLVEGDWDLSSLFRFFSTLVLLRRNSSTIIFTKDSSLLLHAIHSPFYRQVDFKENYTLLWF